jgi:putative SOS response-associated peptidase YedK
MCGRFTVATGDLRGLRARFGLDERVALRQRFNVAPGDEVAAVTRDGAALLRWGFLRDSGYTTINARAESLLARPTWRSALDDGRCLNVPDGFFEWHRRPDGRRQPFWITRADRRPFAFAGLASPWGTCAIVTTTAAPAIAELHPRMPVMLPAAREQDWLDPATPRDAARALLVAFDELDATPVGPAVNDARYDGPRCLEPAPEELSHF